MQGRITSAPVPCFCSWPRSFINSQRDPVTFRCTRRLLLLHSLRLIFGMRMHRRVTLYRWMCLCFHRGVRCVCDPFPAQEQGAATNVHPGCTLISPGLFLLPSALLSCSHIKWASQLFRKRHRTECTQRPHLENGERVHFEADLCSCACSSGRFRPAALSMCDVDLGLNNEQIQTVHDPVTHCKGKRDPFRCPPQEVTHF